MYITETKSVKLQGLSCKVDSDCKENLGFVCRYRRCYCKLGTFFDGKQCGIFCYHP